MAKRGKTKLTKSSSDIRKEEAFYLAVNSIFGPPISVRNTLFEHARRLAENENIPGDLNYWIKTKLVSLGYKETKHWFDEDLKEEVYDFLGDKEYKLIR